MDYLNRTLAANILRISNNDKTLLINGPRQIGKTTLLKHIAETGRKYVTFDNKTDLSFALADPQGFLATYAPPVILDEVQYAGKLFPYIKMLVDGSDERGRVWMTGSQQYEMMSQVTESLAGRVIIIDMLGFSIYERAGLGLEQQAFLPSAKPARLLPHLNAPATFRIIWQGAYPDVVNRDERSRKDFYDSYIRTYLERDVRQLINIGDEATFLTFLKVAAARTGQLLNMADIAKDIGLSQPTVKRWFSVLQASGIIYFLQPYFKNITKRLVKTPKMYFLDTGLAAYLAGWTTPESLEIGASSGAFFESFVISEIIKSYWHNGEKPNLYFFRDEKKNEIDLLIFQDGIYYPIEIKKHATPTRGDIKAFDIFAKLETIGYGCVLCLTPEPQPLAANAIALSIWDI
ncbi:MAG: ATP-binding protein [Deferribacteraceae bacterium]|jgi:predicted AAA+ superfamily ATPase|nr:ATP-binding protein [Deferribacteraceae bacterium]